MDYCNTDVIFLGKKSTQSKCIGIDIKGDNFSYENKLSILHLAYDIDS